MSERSFFSELRRRNVYRAAVIYAASAWVLVQVLDLVSAYFQIPEWAVRWAIIAAVIGFPFWLAFAWFYEFTPEGLKRESEVERHESITQVTGRKLDFAIIGVLGVAVVLLLTDRFVLRQGVNQSKAVAISEKSIAVLPFVDMSQGKDQEYFSDGISEELLNLLAKIPALHVAARTSSFSFKDKDAPIPEIAKTLHVAHVLEGSVRKSGDQVRITTQLIRASDGYHLWSETYDRKLDDIFAIQDEIAAKVVEQLKVTLLGATPKARTTDPKAYALYLQAVQLGRQNTAEALKQSDALLQQVLAIDPRYAPAWTEVARNFGHEADIGLLSNQEGYARARAAADKAVAIDPEFAPAHARLGFVAMVEGKDLSVAAVHLGRALELDPTNLDVLRDAAILLVALGRMDEALVLDEAAFRRDPVNLRSLNHLALNQRRAGRLDDAIASFRTLLTLSPGRDVVHTELGAALLQKGDAVLALAEIEQETSEFWRMVGLPTAYCALGRKDDFQRTLAELIAKYEGDGPYNIAYVYASCGDADKAFEWLAKASRYQDPGLIEIAIEPQFGKIHADPRWLQFVRGIGKAPEQLAQIEFKVTLPAEWQAEAAVAKAAATQSASSEVKP